MVYVSLGECKQLSSFLSAHLLNYKSVITGKDPCVNAVLTEDVAAVASVEVVACCMDVSIYTGSPIYGAVGSLLVGSLLGTVASFIIYTTVAALVGRSTKPNIRLRPFTTTLDILNAPTADWNVGKAKHISVK
uniref:Uncharacterized protein n=1 Tax=Glossina palpalis gambiensis TaxID=67801 RepID=A0A1B0BCP0_9MUSC